MRGERSAAASRTIRRQHEKLDQLLKPPLDLVGLAKRGSSDLEVAIPDESPGVASPIGMAQPFEPIPYLSID